MTATAKKPAAPKTAKAPDAAKIANAKAITAKAEKEAATKDRAKAITAKAIKEPTRKNIVDAVVLTKAADEVDPALAGAAAMFKGKTLTDSDAAPVKADKPKKERVARTESSSETVREIVRLASRPEGATKAELEAATGWKNAGWPWMFFNPKTGKGIAPRHGMKLVVKDRPTAEEGKRALKAYCLVAA